MAIDHLATCGINRGQRCTCALERMTMNSDPRDAEVAALKVQCQRLQEELDWYVNFFETKPEPEFVSKMGNHYNSAQLEDIISEWEEVRSDD